MRESHSQNLMKSSYRAMTLVESAVYIGIFGIIFAAIVQFMFTVQSNNDRTAQSVKLEKAVIFTTQHLEDSFSRIDSLNLANSVFDNSSGVLAMSVDGLNQHYQIDSGRLQFNNGTETNYITPPGYIVTDFYLEQVLDIDSLLVGARVQLSIVSEKDSNIARTVNTSFLTID